MKLIVVTMALVAVAVSAAPSQAEHRRDSFCSESGDFCLYAFKKDGVQKFEIRLAAKYFSRYKLCVWAPDDSRTCRRFRIKDRGRVYGDVVAWRSFFPHEGEGAYDVRWKTSSGPLGPRLGFHV